MVTIEPVSDVEQLRAWHAVMRSAFTDDRPEAAFEDFEATRHPFENPSETSKTTWLAAVDGGEVVGCVSIFWETQANLNRAEVELAVAAHRRREGIGSALFEAADHLCRDNGRTTLSGETYCDAGEDPQKSAGYRFATARGYVETLHEHHMVLDVPMPEDHLASLRAAVAEVEGYDVVTWVGRCPDDLLEQYCLMRERLDADVPSGYTDFEHRAWTAERVRAQEERLGASYTVIVAAARHLDSGQLTGYTVLFVPKGQSEVLWQDDTLVMPDHRGHRLGLLLKLASYDVLRRDHLGRTLIHTWTEVANHPMLRTNERFGYRRVEHMLELERRA